MGRRKGGTPINGWLVIDKPLGMSSAAAVAAVRRITGAAKVGHGGTLDPLATGILPIALGEATKTVPYIMDGAKTYRFRICWGEARSTDDTEGEVTATSPERPERAAIEAALGQFIGVIEQVPPIFSAVKVGGQRAYALARENREVELTARKVRIDRFILLGQTDDDHADFEVASGKGAYMRSLARDLALALGTVGHIALLRRLRVGPFNEDNAISLDKLAELVHSPAAPSPVLPVETVLDDIPALALTEADALRLHNGQAVSLLRMARDALPPVISPGMIVRAMAGQRLVAVACIDCGELRPVRVMNL